MKLNIFIVSIACFSCLVPEAYGSLLAAKALAAAGAVKGAALLGAGALAAKGAAVLAAKAAVAKLAVKGAAVVGAKHAALKAVGAAVLGAKALAVKGLVAKGAAVLAAKKAAIGGAVTLGAKALHVGAAVASGRLVQPTIIRYVPEEPLAIDVRRVPFYRVAEVPRAFPSILADRVSTLVATASGALVQKAGAASSLLSALHGPSVVVEPYEVVEDSLYAVPVVKKDC